MSLDVVLLVVTGLVIVGAIVGLSGPAHRRRLARDIGRMQDPAEGMLEVVTASVCRPAGGAQNASFSLSGILRVPGLAPTHVELKGLATSAKWPEAGHELPVTADRAAPTTVIIHWNQVPTKKQRARILANDAARQEGQHTISGGPNGSGEGEPESDEPAPLEGPAQPVEITRGKAPRRSGRARRSRR